MPRLKNDNPSSYNATFQPSLWAVAYACPAGIINLRTWDHIYACNQLYACTLIYFLFPFAVSSSLRSTPGSVIFTFLVLLRRRDLDLHSEHVVKSSKCSKPLYCRRFQCAIPRSCAHKWRWKKAPNCYTVDDSNVQFLEAVRTNEGGKRLQTAILSTILQCDSL